MVEESLPLCHCAPVCRCLQVMERALGNIYISNPLYRPFPCQSGACSGRKGVVGGGVGGFGGEQVALSTHADTEGASSTHSLAVSLEPLYGDCFISVPVHPLGGWGPRRMTLIF